MSTTYEPAGRAQSAPIVRAASHYRDAAELCAAIRAAAQDAPEFRRGPVKLEFPDGAYNHGPYSRFDDGEFNEGPLQEWQGPLMPEPTPRSDTRAVFAYRMADGTRGQVSCANDQPSLLALADRLGTPAAVRAWSGKIRSGPVKRSAPASSAPHVAARQLWQDHQHREALELARTYGALFFGPSSAASGAIPYMAAESVDLAGHSFTIARSVAGGRFSILHTPSALSLPDMAGRNLDFTSYAAALDWLETSAQCDAWRAKIDAGAAKSAPFDQAQALAWYMGDPDPVPAISATMEAPAQRKRARKPRAAPVEPSHVPTHSAPGPVATHSHDPEERFPDPITPETADYLRQVSEDVRSRGFTEQADRLDGMLSRTPIKPAVHENSRISIAWDCESASLAKSHARTLAKLTTLESSGLMPSVSLLSRDWCPDNPLWGFRAPISSGQRRMCTQALRLAVARMLRADRTAARRPVPIAWPDFERCYPAPRAAPTVGPLLRIPEFDARLRIPPTFALGYLLRAGA